MEQIHSANLNNSTNMSEELSLFNTSFSKENQKEMVNASYPDYPFHNYTYTEDEIKHEFQLMLRQYLYELYKKKESEQLYEPSLILIIVLSLLYGSICLMSLLGNGLVIWVVMVSRRMRTVTNLYIGNLALADIIIGLFSIPFQFQAALLQRWNLPNFMCAFCPFFQVLSVNLSVLTLAAIAVDRHRAVLHPLSSRQSRKVSVVVIACVWAISLLLAIPTFLDYKVITSRKLFNPPHPYCRNVGLSHEFRLYYNLSLVATQYFIPLLIISVAYIRMAIRLWGRTMPGNKEEGRDAIMLRNKKRAIKMLILVVLIFGVCWLPLQTYNFVQYVYPKINNYQYINIIWFCIHWLAMSNSCVNPFIYAIYNEKFQEEFARRLSFIQKCSHVFARKREGSHSQSVLLVLTERPCIENESLPLREQKMGIHQSRIERSRSPRTFRQRESKSCSNSSSYSFVSRSTRSSTKNLEHLRSNSIPVDGDANASLALKLFNEKETSCVVHNNINEVITRENQKNAVDRAAKDYKICTESQKVIGCLKTTSSLLVKSDSAML